VARTQDPGHIPGPVFIPGVAAIRLIWLLPNGKSASNILHGHYTSSPPNTQTAVNTLYTAVTTAFTASGLAAAVVGTAELTGVGVRDLAESSPGVGLGEIVSSLSAVTGSATGDALPANVSFVVSLKTGLSRQANRGRVYLPGFAESANQPGGVASDAAKNAAVDFIGRINSTALPASGMSLVIAHPARAGYTGSTGTNHPARSAGFVTVTSILALNNVWDSTRLRSLR